MDFLCESTLMQSFVRTKISLDTYIPCLVCLTFDQLLNNFPLLPLSTKPPDLIPKNGRILEKQQTEEEG